jgi:hypothetical protein
VFVISLLNFSDIFLIVKSIDQDTVIKYSEILPSVYIGLNVKYPFLLPDFTWNLIFSNDFQKVPKYQSSWKSAQFEAKLFDLDRRTNKDRETVKHEKAISCFSIFANAPKYLLPLRCEPLYVLVKKTRTLTLLR